MLLNGTRLLILRRAVNSNAKPKGRQIYQRSVRVDCVNHSRRRCFAECIHRSIDPCLRKKRVWRHTPGTVRRMTRNPVLNHNGHCEGAPSEELDSEVQFELGYVTDVEGNLDWFERYVSISRVLTYEAPEGGGPLQLELLPGKCFVYGGDVFDKGPGALRLAMQLVSLKKRYPDRVWLLVGNRDVIKMKLTSDLNPEYCAANPAATLPGPYWQREGKRASLKEFLRSLAKERSIEEGKAHQGKTHGDGDDDRDNDENDDRIIAELDTLPNRLRFYLAKTQGSPRGFDFRRQELAILNKCSMDEVSEEEVVESFQSAKVEREYLQAAQVGAVVGNSLFIHGAVNPVNLSFLPRDNQDAVQEVTGERVEEGVQVWIEKLNQFAQASVQEWIKHPLWEGEDWSWRGGSELMGYVYNAAIRGHSVVIAGYLDNGALTQLAPEVQDYLAESGIRRVVVGHKPVGQCPTVVRCSGGEDEGKGVSISSREGPPLELIYGDTSFSDVTAADYRGKAVCEVLIRGSSSTQNRTWVHGILADGSPICCRMPVETSTFPESFLGLEVEPGWYSVGIIDRDNSQSDRKFLLRQGEGYSIEYKEVHVEDLRPVRNTNTQATYQSN